MSVAVAPRFAPKTIAIKVMIKDCNVIGTPNGIGNEKGAIIQIRAVVNPIIHNSCILKCVFFIKYTP